MQLFAERMQNIPFSTIRTILEQVNRLEAQGRHIFRLDAGRPDFDTPQHIKQACIAALDNSEVYYSSNYGTLALRNAIAAKLKTENNLEFDSQDEIIVTAGVSEGIVSAMLALLNPGDEVLLLEPVFPAYRMAIEMAGAKAVTVKTYSEFGYQVQPQDLLSRVSSKTKMLVLANPGNPTGTVLSLDTLKTIAKFAISHELLVMSDEIYEKLIYDDARHISIATLDGMRERTITLGGFSKSYAMTGWRLGYIAADGRVVDAIVRIHQNNVVCANTLAQAAGIAALEGPKAPLLQMVKELDRRRQMMMKQLNRMPVLDYVRPQGAMYIYVETSRLGLSANELCANLLECADVAVVPWDDNHIRLSFGNHYDHLKNAMTHFTDYLLTI